MEIHVFASEAVLIKAYGQYFIQKAQRAIEAKGQFNVVLSGGNSPRKVYGLLASGFSKSLDWQKVFFFFGDERYVPAAHPDNNALMAEQVLFMPLQISDDHIFRINTSLSPLACASDYMKMITTHFANSRCCFDLILLGLGEDGHTASLFPGTDILHEVEPTVQAVPSAGDRGYRISMTAPLINLADSVAFLVYGEGKKEAVKEVIKGTSRPKEFPAQLIRPVSDDLHWFLDGEAARLL